MSTAATLSAPPPLPQPPRATPSLGRAFGGIWRLTVRRFFAPGQMIAFGVLLGLFALLTLVSQRHGRAAEFFDWVILFLITFLVPVVSFLSGAGTIRDDMQASTVDYVFTRPVSRLAFVVFRYLSQMMCMQVNALLALGVALAIGFSLGVPGLAEALPLLLLAQFLTVATFTAFGFLCGTLTARHIVLGLFYAGTIEAGVGNIPTQVNRLSMLHHVRAMLEGITPRSLDLAPAASPLATTVFLLIVSAAMITISAFLFNRREMAGEKQKDA